MADEELPINGKDVTLELVLNGVPQKVISYVTRFTERPVFETIKTKPIGTSRTYNDQDFEGWAGDVELAEADPQHQAFIDAYIESVRNRIPMVLLITRTKRYRNGTPDKRTYKNVKLTGWESQDQRGQSSTIRLQWETGDHRF